MNTLEYIDKFCLTLQGMGFQSPRSYDVNIFSELISAFHAEHIDVFSGVGLSVLPKSDALKKIWNKFYLDKNHELIYKWDSKYFRSKYFHSVDGCEFIYYPAKNPKKLIVNFSSMGINRFDRYSRYWDVTENWDSDSAHLFFKDDSFSYFLGTEKNPKESVYFRLIRDISNIYNLSRNHVYTVGGSMGGYAAIFYALSLDLGGAIVAAPQIDKKSMVAHKFNNWTKNSNQTGSLWRDLNIFAYAFDRLPYLYIEYGNYPADVFAAEGIIEVYRRSKSLCIARKANWNEHTVSEVLSKELVESTISFFEQNRKLDTIY